MTLRCHGLAVGILFCLGSFQALVGKPRVADDEALWKAAPAVVEHAPLVALATDSDGDGIYDENDTRPNTPDALLTFPGSDYTLTILGSGRVANLV